jgi:hypothetical protein
MKISFGVNLLPHLQGKTDMVEVYGLTNEGDAGHTVVNQSSNDIRELVKELEKVRADYAPDILAAKKAHQNKLKEPIDITKRSKEAEDLDAVERRDMEFRKAIRTINDKLPPPHPT